MRRFLLDTSIAGLFLDRKRGVFVKREGAVGEPVGGR